MRTWDRIAKNLQPYAPGKKVIRIESTDRATPATRFVATVQTSGIISTTKNP